MTNEMKPERKYWWSNNFLGVLMIAMLAAYFSYDLVDKHQNRLDHMEFMKELAMQKEKNTEKFRVFAWILLSDPNTDDENKVILREYLKLDTRSGGTR